MTSQVVDDRLQQVLAELRQMREDMVVKADLAGFATKADLAGFATKADLAACATKADLAACATKADLAGCATKADLASLETRMTRWMFGALMAQAALIVAIVKLLP